MTYALVTPTKYGVTSNPGWHMITAGIKHILSLRKKSFVEINMLEHDPEGWEAAKGAEAIIVCGNPRFGMGEANWYWETELWDHIAVSGLPVIDGWAGSSFPLQKRPSLEEMLKQPKNEKCIEVLKKAKFCIARDNFTFKIHKKLNVRSDLTYCSSFWAKDWYQTFAWVKSQNLIVLRAVEWLTADRIRQMISLFTDGKRLFKMVTLTLEDQQLIRKLGFETVLIHDPVDLLNNLSRSNKVLSMRLHATIPALSLSCRVCHIALDGRSEALKHFKVPVFLNIDSGLPFTALSFSPKLPDHIEF